MRIFILSLPLGEMSRSDREGWYQLTWLFKFALIRTCPLFALSVICSANASSPKGESREGGADCTPDASSELLRRLVRVLLLPSRLAPCHLPQGGRLFLLCFHAGIKKDCHQAVPKYYLFSSTGNVALSKSPARTCRASAILYKISSENGRTMFGASMELK